MHRGSSEEEEDGGGGLPSWRSAVGRREECILHVEERMTADLETLRFDTPFHHNMDTMTVSILSIPLKRMSMNIKKNGVSKYTPRD